MTVALVVLAIVALAAVGAAVWLYSRQRRTAGLQRGFGAEYQRTVRETGSQRRAEHELEARRERVQALRIRPLSREQRAELSGEWQHTQARFVDDPGGAITGADDLVGVAMEKLGYPVGDFEQRAADISVEHPEFVRDYRAAHAIALRQRDGSATTEDLRQAMVHFRALFEDLLTAGDGAQTADGRRRGV